MGIEPETDGPLVLLVDFEDRKCADSRTEEKEMKEKLMEVYL